MVKLVLVWSYWLNAGQNDQQGKDLTGQVPFLARHCPLTRCGFKPCDSNLYFNQISDYDHDSCQIF